MSLFSLLFAASLLWQKNDDYLFPQPRVDPSLCIMMMMCLVGVCRVMSVGV